MSFFALVKKKFKKFKMFMIIFITLGVPDDYKHLPA